MKIQEQCGSLLKNKYHTIILLYLLPIRYSAMETMIKKKKSINKGYWKSEMQTINLIFTEKRLTGI